MTGEKQALDQQAGNRAWWTRNPMAYDWRGEVDLPRFSPGWFDAIDARFVHGARLFATERTPFDRIIPFERLRDARVLEIGCGMGLHSELMARAGARLTAIDISPTSIEATRRRLELNELEGDIREGDACSLPFADGAFDFVWSWGVIHHSAHTGRIVREIARVVDPGGEARVMVYHRNGVVARDVFVRDGLLRGGLRRHSLDELLNARSDGHTARFYVADQFEDLFRTFFRDVSSQICGQDSDALPLPAHLRRHALRLVPESWLRRAQARRGSFVFLRAATPR